ncbi:MAG: hypothetical protein MRQ11_04600 [Candidatus Midichloria mitochondrii]|nr:hypothetical protein [Candidatus Midichloria mitochondrii]
MAYVFKPNISHGKIGSRAYSLRQTEIKHYEKPPAFETVYQSWDCAIKTSRLNNYSVVQLGGVYNANYYLIDVLRERDWIIHLLERL